MQESLSLPSGSMGPSDKDVLTQMGALHLSDSQVSWILLLLLLFYWWLFER